MPPEIKAEYNPTNAAAIQYNRETSKIGSLEDLEGLLGEVDREKFYTEIVITDDEGNIQTFLVQRKALKTSSIQQPGGMISDQSAVRKSSGNAS